MYEFFDFETLWTDEPDRSQDIPELYHPNGAVFVTSIEAWRKHESFYTPHTVGYEMPPERSFDVDEPWELKLVRSLLE
ncbi:acylneuraminate cytidylyltransferase [Natrialba magadii ATCC 43099]|uniref:Acylneuraminate cytidylyltransferase n=1 Tax=Natrialba magadii (strain ATCC 43099 / DSM 3394 / CCM 3739 / CIP 104546 / IAM 13178 / JCM 8861 / NBRC 102185 / NCIMB 2190 / MS3) TaxID=547559 RepID=L9V9X9_NATMM|nr:acylneuraminate cytidylyltransferase [Natrialba magadii ATCC 43099]